jgi:hypothetical protein
LRDALNARLTNPNFFVWITVEPNGQGTVLASVDQIVQDTERWLSSLDPEAISSPDAVPERQFVDPAASVRIRAIPKRPEARLQRSESIVGNPEPVVAGWV